MWSKYSRYRSLRNVGRSETLVAHERRHRNSCHETRAHRAVAPVPERTRKDQTFQPDVPNVPTSNVPASNVPASNVLASNVPASNVPASNVPASNVLASNVPASQMLSAHAVAAALKPVGLRPRMGEDGSRMPRPLLIEIISPMPSRSTDGVDGIGGTSNSKDGGSDDGGTSAYGESKLVVRVRLVAARRRGGESNAAKMCRFTTLGDAAETMEDESGRGGAAASSLEATLLGQRSAERLTGAGVSRVVMRLRSDRNLWPFGTDRSDAP